MAKKTSTLDKILNGTYEYGGISVKKTTTKQKPYKVKKKENYTSQFNDGYQFGDVTKTLLGITAPVKQEIAPIRERFTNDEGYTYFGKNYGDYWYQDYEKNKDLKVFTKDNKFYIQNGDTYEEVGKGSLTGQRLTSQEKLKRDMEAAKKDGHIYNSELSILDQLLLDSEDLTEKEREDFTKDLKRQQEDKEEEHERKYKMRYGGAGFKGTLGELSKYGEAIDDNVIEPIRDIKDNWDYGKKTEQLMKESYKKMNGEENNFDELREEVAKYSKFNKDIVENGNALDQTIQSYPNQVGGFIEGVKGGGIGSVIGGIGGAILGGATGVGAGKGAMLGAKYLGGGGYIAGQSQYTYELEAGAQYMALLDLGVPEDIAKKEAKKVGTVNALIESGESLLDIVSFGKFSTLKQSLVGDLVEEYGEEQVKKWVGTEIVKQVVKEGTKNAFSEGVEETLQEGTAILSERSATDEAGIVRDDSGDIERLTDSFTAGALGGVISGGGRGLVGSTMSSLNPTQTQTQENISYTQNEEGTNEKYTYKASKNDSEYKKFTNETAVRVANNSKRAHNIVDSLVKLSEKTGVKFGLTNSQELKQMGYDPGKNLIVNGVNAKDQGILINVDSPRAIEFITGHETTHLLEGVDGYTELQTMLYEMAESKGELETRRANIEKLYKGVKGANIDSELTADLVGDYLFNDANFIKSLTQKPTLFTKIKEVIDDLVVKYKGTAEEKQLRAVQKKFKEVLESSDMAQTQQVNASNTQVNEDIAPIKQQEVAKTDNKPAKTEDNFPIKEQLDLLVKFNKLVNETNTSKDKLYEQFGVKNNTEMTKEQFIEAIDLMEKGKQDAKVEEAAPKTKQDAPVQDIAPIKETKNNKYSDNLNEYFKIKKEYDNNKDMSKRQALIKKLEAQEDKLTQEELQEVFKLESQNLLTNEDTTPIKQELADLSNEIKSTIKDTKKELKSLTKELNEVKSTIEEAKAITKETLPGLEQQYSEDFRNIQDTDIGPDTGEFIGFTEDVPIKPRHKNDITSYIKDTFGIDRYDARLLYDKIASLENPTVEDVYNELENYRMVHYQETLTDPYVNEIKKHIRKTKIDMSDLKNQITDYNLFRKNNFGNLKLGNDGLPIDTFYEELLEMYPGYFDSNIITEADQLEAITDFMRDRGIVYDGYHEISDEHLYNIAENLLTDIGNKERYDASKRNDWDTLQYLRQHGDDIAPTNYSLSDGKIQGLEEYSKDEIKQLSKEYIQEKLVENGLYDVRIKGIDIHGSRNRGTARTNSDLDVVVEYDGDIREDDLFSILNEEPMYIEDVQVDINPITESLESYMKRSNAYDKEVLANTKYSLAGEKAVLTKRQQQLKNQAIQMEKENYSPDTIWSRTGFIKEDGKWKFYIRDAKLKKDALSKLGFYGTFKAKDVLDAKEIFAAYPEMAEMDLTIGNLYEMFKDDTNVDAESKELMKTIAGSTTDTDGVLLNTPKLTDLEYSNGILAHENQHHIDDIEGINNGHTANLKGRAYKLHPNELNAETTRVMNAMTDTQLGKYSPKRVKDMIIKYYEQNNYRKVDVDKVINMLERSVTNYFASDPDIMYSLNEESSVQDKINQSFTMEDVDKMVEMAFRQNDIKNWYENKYKNGKEWLEGEGIDEVITYLENTEIIINNYLNPLGSRDESYYNGDYYIEDIMEAYQNGTLVGNKPVRKDLDTSVESNYVDDRFYAPQNIETTQELYNKANQRVTNSNRQEVYKARAEFIIAAHNPNAIENLGLDKAEVNTKLKNWANYTRSAMELSNSLNENVARQNRWSGLENSSIVNTISVSNEQMESLVKEVKGDSSGWQRQYITSTMLALDTHINYSNLTFEFDQQKALSETNAAGDYDHRTDTIRIGNGYQNTVAHEIGHYIDYQWLREIVDNKNVSYPLSEYRENSIYWDLLTPEQQQFVKNFNKFITGLRDSATMGSEYGSRNVDYYQKNTEVFARFVGKFTEWVKNTATNGRYGYDSKFYKDNFTESQYREFIKILQEKSMLDTTGEQYSLSNANDIAPIKDENLTYGEDIRYNASNTQQTEDIAPVKEQTLKEHMEAEDPVIKAVQNQIKRHEAKVKTEEDAYANRNVKPKKKENIKDKLGRTWDTFQSHMVNRNRQIDKLAKKSGNKEIKFKGDRVNNISGEVGGDIFTAQTDNYGNVIGKALDAPFEAARQKGIDAEFDNYLKHQSNIERHQRGKGSKTVSAKMSQEYVRAYESKYPEFKEWSTDVYTYNQNLLDNAVKNGLIDDDFRNMLTSMYGKYVPFYSEQETGPSVYMTPDEIKSSRPIKRAKGGSDTDLLGVEQAMIQQTYAYKNAISKNDLYKEIGKAVNKHIELGADVRTSATDLDSTLYADENGKYLTYYENGHQKTVTISDELYSELNRDLEKQIKDLEEKYSLITKPLQKISQIRGQILTTYNPMFVTTNPFKDVKDALYNTKYLGSYVKNVFNASTFKDSVKGTKVNEYAAKFKELTGKDITKVKDASNLKGQAKAIYNDYQAGTMWNRFVTSYGTNATSMEYGDNGVEVKKKNKGFLNKIESFNNYTEIMFRYPEFKSTLEKGGSFTEALYNAREVTTNFGRGGTIAKAINRNGATFYNTSIQGMDKFFRNFTENGVSGFVRASSRAVLLGMTPAILNHLLFGGDEEDEDYEALPDYVKDNYFLFKTGDGEFIRIPKGRMEAVFGSTARRTLELASGEEDAFKGYAKNVSDQIGASNPLEENILAPIIQAANNEAWYGGDLVPTRLQNKPVAEQYDESTDEFSKWLGKQLNVSPYKINYVIDQYSGGVGDIVLPMITKEAQSNGALLAPMKDKFVVNSTDDNKYVGELYDLGDELTIKANSSEATDEDLLKNKYLNSVKSEMSELYKEKREVQNSDLSKEEKYKKVQGIQKQINDLAKEGLDSYEEVEVNTNYSSVGGKEYYKTTKGEWYSVNEEEATDLNTMGMTSYEKDNYFSAKNSIYSIKDKYEDSEDEDKYTSQKREIIDEVRGTNLTDEVKAYLYDKSYASTDKLNVVLNTSIPFDTYLDLEYENFTADKDKYGRTINGSKKEKIMNFIESSNLDYNQKIILHKIYYPADDRYNYDIADYVFNNVEAYEDRINILETLGFRIGEDGVIYWD